MSVKKYLSFSFWLMLPDPPSNLFGKHIFTFPKNDDLKMIQVNISPSFTLCVSVRAEGVCFGKADAPGSWNHYAVTLKQISGAIDARFYINGKFMAVKAISVSALVATGANPLTGFVLGQDVDNGVVNEIVQSFYGKMTKLYIYGHLLNNAEIKSCYRHQEPVNDRLLWWEELRGEELRGIDTGNNDVRERSYPKEFVNW
uniref:Pentraxin (PTX) domain-containing protein n=1 Tax=Clytia hemisphaerica TaxID=252671 RepID=A0A7M5V198_9CNID